MAYENGTFTDLDDLRTKIRTFLATQGLTVTTGNAIHNGSDIYVDIEYLALTHSGTYDALEIRSGTGEAGGAITGHSGGRHQMRERTVTVSGVGAQVMSFPAAYYFFYDAATENFVCVVNFNTTHIQWMGFGKITKLGTWTGGVWAGASYGDYFTTGSSTAVFRHQHSYYSYYGSRADARAFFFGARGDTVFGAGANSPNMTLQCDIDGVAGDWIGNSETNYPSFSGCIMNTYMRWKGYSTLTDRTILVPIEIGVLRDINNISHVGYLPTARHVNIKNYAIGQIITLGADKWMVFPLIEKSLGEFASMGSSVELSAAEQSGVYGFAIKYDGP